MLESFVKYFAIIYGALYVFLKSLNYKQTRKLNMVCLFSSIFLSIVIIPIRIVFPESTVLIIIILCSIINSRCFITLKWYIIISTTVISCAVSYSFHFLATVLPTILFGIISYRYNIQINITAILLASYPIQALLMFFLFKIRRFKRGFPFLYNIYFSFVGIFISVIIFLFYTIYSRSMTQNLFKFMSVLGVAISIILIIYWCQRSITKTYIARVKENNLEEANRIIAKKDEYIEELTKNNDTLSKIIHRDNKLIPALELSLREFIHDVVEREPEFQQKAENILAQLQTISEERSEIMSQYKKGNKKLPQTKISSIDMILKYLLSKANENDIDFDVIVSSDIRFMTENYISEERLRTLIADLLENAMIAVKLCKCRRVLFTIGVCGNFYEISIDDSGVDFEAETLRNLGKTRVTTHKDSGGSGIGMMTTFEILRETGASLIIKEYPKIDYSFTKRVSVRFDGKNEFITLLRENEAVTDLYNIYC